MDVAVTNGVYCRDNELLDLGVGWELVDLVLIDIVHPVPPLVGGWVVEVVVDLASIELGGEDLLIALEFGQVLDTTVQDLLEVLVNRPSELRVASDAERPNDGEEEHAVHHLNSLTLVQVLGEAGIVKLFQESAPKPEQGLDESLVVSGSGLDTLAAHKGDNWIDHDVN